MGRIGKKSLDCRLRRFGLFVLSAFCFLSFSQTSFAKRNVSLEVKIVYATAEDSNEIVPELTELAKDFMRFGLKSFSVIDRKTLNLSVGVSRSFLLPSGISMSVSLIEQMLDGPWKLKIESEELKFKSAVLIGAGGTVAVGGANHRDGKLIVALSHPPREKK